MLKRLNFLSFFLCLSLQEFGVNSLKDLVKIYDIFVGRIVGNIKRGVNTVKKLISGEISLPLLFERFVDALENIPEMLSVSIKLWNFRMLDTTFNAECVKDILLSSPLLFSPSFLPSFLPLPYPSLLLTSPPLFFPLLFDLNFNIVNYLFIFIPYKGLTSVRYQSYKTTYEIGSNLPTPFY